MQNGSITCSDSVIVEIAETGFFRLLALCVVLFSDKSFAEFFFL